MDNKTHLLTNRQGHPVYNNRDTKTVGDRGPIVLENYNFIEKISHFDRERIPERVVHARGAGAHGYFESYGTAGNDPVSKYTCAKVFCETGYKTPVFVRFSTVIGGTASPESQRDPRGFAVKFYTKEGILDMVGNNLKVFFIRDPISFPDLVHSFKPDPVTNIQDTERIFDFVSHHPEALHMVTWLFSPWGIPADYRHMEGSGVNTYRWYNKDGDSVLIKYHWEPKCGVKNLKQCEADKIQATDFNHATRDLFNAIEKGDYPEWELSVQIMEDREHPELDFDPLDPTKLWPKSKFPFLKVGKMVLNKNPKNYFNEVEQSAFSTGALVPGTDFSEDKLLVGRTFAYSDTHRYRLGSNYLRLPINRPKNHVNTNLSGGQMNPGDEPMGTNPHVNYEPSHMDNLRTPKITGRVDFSAKVSGDRIVAKTIPVENNYGQAGEAYRNMKDWEKDELISNLVQNMKHAKDVIQNAMIEHFTRCDREYGTRVAEGLKKMKSRM